MKNLKRWSLAVSTLFALSGVWFTAASQLVNVGCGTGTNTGDPQANAGGDQEVLTTDNVALDGQSSTNVSPTTAITWSFDSKPAGSTASLANANTLTPSFTADVAGVYVVRLNLTGATSSEDTVTITAKNVLAQCSIPSGSAVVERTRFTNLVENAINLDQPGGKVSGETSRVMSGRSIMSYSWNQALGPGATATNGTTNATLDFTAPGLIDILNLAESLGGNTGVGERVASDRYKWQPMRISRLDTQMWFTLTVTDNTGESDTTTCTPIYLQDNGEEIHTQSGLTNVGLNTTVYLSGPNLFAPTANTTTQLLGGPISVWNWSITPPAGSGAVFADTGTTASNIEFPKFTPDVEGLYKVDFSSADYTKTCQNTSATGTTTCDTTCRYAGGPEIATNCKSVSNGSLCSATCPVSPAPAVTCTCGISGELFINASTWVGVGTIGGTTPVAPQCANCHDGAPVTGSDKVVAWEGTLHSHIFADNADNGVYAGLAPTPYLWEFQTVGYNPHAANDGFDDIASFLGFSWSNQTYQQFLDAFNRASPNYLPKLANTQCENCHGPGGAHNGDPEKIGVAASQFGVCGQCHIQEAAWTNSAHNSTGVTHGSGNYQTSWLTNPVCSRCHQSQGFPAYLEGFLAGGFEEGEHAVSEVIASDTQEKGIFVGVTCAGCHSPHSAANEKQLRLVGNVNMIITNPPTTVDAGKAATCYMCHDGFYDFGETSCKACYDGSGSSVVCEDIDINATSYSRIVHYNPQAPVLEGKGVITDLNADGTEDFELTENSFHSGADFILSRVTGDPNLPDTNNKCITCHMAAGPASNEEGFNHVGGHAFRLRTAHNTGHLHGEEGGDEGEDATVPEAGGFEYIQACTSCHNSLTTFNRLARADYDGDGSVEGIEDEIKGLMYNVSNLIYYIDGNFSDTTSDKGPNCPTTGDVTYAGDGLQTDPGKGSIGTRCSIATCNPTVTYPSDPSCVCTGEIDVDVISYLSTTSSSSSFFMKKVSPMVRRSIYNYYTMVRDGSLGVHNAAFAIQTLQGTYKALGITLGGKPATFTYQTDFPNATLR